MKQCSVLDLDFHLSHNFGQSPLMEKLDADHRNIGTVFAANPQHDFDTWR